eukprot:GFKZ01013372.1.p1 GENE.GFKZ01013372.1~~GFKZ01013372.1.p1  ORF type:complete len:509 (-),score=81.50 GFKZ01013372.1:691-2169(-)
MCHHYVLFLVLALLLLAAHAPAKLLQLQIIHRHGARPHLIKHSTDPGVEESSSGPSLFPGGVVQLSNLAEYISESYIPEIRGMTRRSIYAVSSNLPRTLLSSRAFLDNLTDSSSIVPTFIFADDENDWRLRGYALCPRLAQRVDDFTRTDEYAEMRDRKEAGNESNLDFVRRVAEPLVALGEIDVEDASLEGVFNVYDRYLIIREGHFTEGEPRQRFPDQDVEPLDPEQFERLRRLADWYESSKFSFQVHGLHVAGGLVGEIRRQMERVVEGDGRERERPRGRQVVEFSAHYPTLLTLLASLRAGSGDGLVEPADRIPGFGAALLIEVRRDEEEGEAYVTLKWYPGDGVWRRDADEDFDGRVVEISLERAPCDAVGGNRCRVTDFLRLMEEAVVDESEFCDICQSEADFCVALRGSCGLATKVVSGVVGSVVGVLLGLTLAYVYARKVGKRKRRMFESASDEQGEVWGGHGAVFGDGAADVPAPGTFREVTP